MPRGAKFEAKALVCLLLGSSLLSCGRLSRHQQCNQAIDHINSALAEIEPETVRAVDDPRVYTRIATLYEALDAKLEPIAQKNPKLGDVLASYREVIADAADAARAAAPGPRAEAPTSAATASSGTNDGAIAGGSAPPVPTADGDSDNDEADAVAPTAAAKAPAPGAFAIPPNTLGAPPDEVLPADDLETPLGSAGANPRSKSRRAAKLRARISAAASSLEAGGQNGEALRLLRKARIAEPTAVRELEAYCHGT